jgi:uroporphyrinogen decarboxylase
VMMHTCGSSSWAYEDFIEMGIHAVDTLQPEAADMSPEHLKRTFGGRLAFHGCISTAGVLAYGSVDDVVDDVRKTLEIMMPGGGYCLAPTHMIQDNTPTENAVAMYEAAHRFGVY